METEIAERLTKSRAKLRKLKVSRVDLVDAGAAPGAHILIAKADEPDELARIAELEAQLAQIENRTFGKLLAPQESELTSQARSYARAATKSALLSRDDAGPVLKSIADEQSAPLDAVIREALAGQHGAELAAVVKEETARSLRVLRDVMSRPDPDELQKQERLRDVLLADLEEVNAEVEMLRALDEDAVSAFHMKNILWADIRREVTKRRNGDLKKLKWADAVRVMKSEHNPDFERLVSRFEHAERQHGESLRKGQQMNETERVKKGADLEREINAQARAMFSDRNLTQAQAVAKFMLEPEGVDLYNRYSQVIKKARVSTTADVIALEKNAAAASVGKSYEQLAVEAFPDESSTASAVLKYAYSDAGREYYADYFQKNQPESVPVEKTEHIGPSFDELAQQSFPHLTQAAATLAYSRTVDGARAYNRIRARDTAKTTGPA